MVEFLTQLGQFLIEIAGFVLVCFACLGVKKLVDWLQSKTKNEQLTAAMEDLEKTVIDGIYFTEQTVVSTYKNNGNWNADTQKEAADACKEYVDKTLSDVSKKYLSESNQIFLEDLIKDKIEAELCKIHKGVETDSSASQLKTDEEQTFDSEAVEE